MLHAYLSALPVLPLRESRLWKTQQPRETLLPARVRCHVVEQLGEGPPVPDDQTHAGAARISGCSRSANELYIGHASFCWHGENRASWEGLMNDVVGMGEAVLLLNLSEYHVRLELRRGRLVGGLVGGRYLFDRASVKRLAAELARERATRQTAVPA